MGKLALSSAVQAMAQAMHYKGTRMVFTASVALDVMGVGSEW